MAAVAGGALCAATGCSFQPTAVGKGIKLEVAVFEGGYGIQWHKAVARRYEALHPGVEVNLWGDPRVDEKIKPRILRRNPPDMASCGLPAWKLLVAGKLYPLDAALASPAYDAPGRAWQETLAPGVLEDFRYRGSVYAAPSNLGAWVCWYSRRQFREHGWDVPTTWSGFLALCEKIRAAGVAPLAFQGKYPTYAWSTLLSLYQRLVPFDQWYAIQDLKPGAFLDPEFIHASALMQEVAVKHFEAGALAMTHTESQMEFVNGRAAMCFCGLWLKNEMKLALPPGFEMACFAVPVVEGGKGDPRAIYGGGAETCFVFSDSRHPAEAADFMKFMLSRGSAQDYVKRLDTLSPVRDCAEGVVISPELQSAVDAMKGSTRIFSDRLGILYLEFNSNALQQGLADLVSGHITPEAFARKLEDGVEAVRRNPDIYKPPAMGVPVIR